LKGKKGVLLRDSALSLWFGKGDFPCRIHWEKEEEEPKEKRIRITPAMYLPWRIMKAEKKRKELIAEKKNFHPNPRLWRGGIC